MVFLACFASRDNLQEFVELRFRIRTVQHRNDEDGEAKRECAQEYNDSAEW